MRINPQDFCMADAMPFQQHYECRTQYPVVDVIADDKSFLNVRANLSVGDRITVCSYKKVDSRSGVSEGLTGIANVRVTDVSDKGVVLVLETAPVIVREPKPQPAPELADEALLVKKVFGGGYAVFDKKGNSIEQFKTKVEAKEFSYRFGDRKAA